MKDIFVVTHTQSEHHVAGVVGGWYDTPLTDLGRMQAERAAQRVETLVAGRPAEVFSSDLLRAHQTAEPIAARLGAAITDMSDLRERSYGAAGGRPQAWLDERVELPGRDGDRLDHRDPIEGAETKREVLVRIYRAMDVIVARPAPVQVIVTHGGSMAFVIAAWIGMPLESAGHVNFKSTSGGITHLQEDDKYLNRYVISLNDTAHLTWPGRTQPKAEGDRPRRRR